MSKPNDHIGDKLRAAIKAKGITQADVARHFKVAAATVSSDWIKHGRVAKKHIPELVNYFGLPYQYWFGAEVVGGEVNPGITLTQEQKQFLSLLSGIRKDARIALMTLGGYLSRESPERRKENRGHVPERRRWGRKYNDNCNSRHGESSLDSHKRRMND